MSNPRFWRVSCVGAGVLLSVPLLISAFAQQPRPAPQPMPSPNAPTNQNFPQGLDGPPLTKEPSQQQLDKENQKAIRQEVQELYTMVAALKEEVEKTDSNTVFSVAFVKKAQAIEKLAKNIKDRAKR